MEDDPTYDLSIARVSGRAPVCEATLRSAMVAALRHHQVHQARINVALVDDAAMAELNNAHLGRIDSTDVLAFDLCDEPDHNGGHFDRGRIDGEIVVSLETAGREASARGHSLDSEVALYVVHGTLHLLGYTDNRTEDADVMHKQEDEILSRVGAGPVYRNVPT